MAAMVYEGFHKIEVIETEIKGQVVARERLHLKDAVAGIVVDTAGRIGLVKQHRPAIQKHTWEIPAGLLDKPHLSVLDTLLEELQEECEITPEEVLLAVPAEFPPYHPVIGSSDSTLTFYYIYVKEQTDKQVADADVEEVRWFTPSQVASMIAGGEIRDGKTLLGYFMYRQQPTPNALEIEQVTRLLKMQEIKQRMDQSDTHFIQTARADMTHLLEIISSMEMEMERLQGAIHDLTEA